MSKLEGGGEAFAEWLVNSMGKSKSKKGFGPGRAAPTPQQIADSERHWAKIKKASETNDWESLLADEEFMVFSANMLGISRQRMDDMVRGVRVQGINMATAVRGADLMEKLSNAIIDFAEILAETKNMPKNSDSIAMGVAFILSDENQDTLLESIAIAMKERGYMR